jgi:hypothetical protein
MNISNFKCIIINVYIIGEEVSFEAFRVSSNELLKELGFTVGARALILASFSSSKSDEKQSPLRTVAQSFGFTSPDNRGNSKMFQFAFCCIIAVCLQIPKMW